MIYVWVASGWRHDIFPTTRSGLEWAGAPFFGQKHISFDAANPRQGHHSATQHALEIGNVAGHNAQTIIIEA